MSQKLRRRELIALLAATGLAALGCEKRDPGARAGSGTQPTTNPSGSAATTPGVTATAIKVGSYGPLSGPAAAWGVVLKGMDAYFQYINDKGGVHGRKIEFLYRDDQYNPSKTPGIVRELVEKERVFAMIGGIGTANGRSVADYLLKKNVPFFTPSSGDKSWTIPGTPNVYTVFPRYVTEGEILGRYAIEELEASRVGVLYQDDDFGKQGLEGVQEAVASADNAELAVSVSCQPTDTDLAGQVSQIVEAAPGVLIIYAAPKQAVNAVKMLDARKKKPQIITSFVLSDPILFRMAGTSWEGTITAAAGARSGSDIDAVKQYRDVLAKYGKDLPVGNFTLSGFQYAIPFVEALHRAGKDLTRESFYEALHSFKAWTGPGLYWKGKDLGAPLTFSAEQHLGNQKMYLLRAEDGKWEQLTDWLSTDE